VPKECELGVKYVKIRYLTMYRGQGVIFTCFRGVN
jgi:hypothetical protein